jgi:hypothetical protein
MKCPECVTLGLMSRFNEFRVPPNKGTVERYYDEAGAHHVHDATFYRVQFTCSNGHSYMQTWQSRCPCKTCDWNEREDVKASEKPIGEG